MYTYWGVKKKNDKDEGQRFVIHNIQSGTKESFDNEVILHRLTQNLLTQTAANGPFERQLKKAKKAQARTQRGAFTKGEKINILEIEVKKAGSHADSTYARFILNKVKIDSVKNVDATAGTAQDNYAEVVMTLAGKPESTHTNDYAKVQGEKAAA